LKSLTPDMAARPENEKKRGSRPELDRQWGTKKGVPGRPSHGRYEKAPVWVQEGRPVNVMSCWPERVRIAEDVTKTKRGKADHLEKRKTSGKDTRSKTGGFAIKKWKTWGDGWG